MSEIFPVQWEKQKPAFFPKSSKPPGNPADLPIGYNWEHDGESHLQQTFTHRQKQQ